MDRRRPSVNRLAALALVVAFASAAAGGPPQLTPSALVSGVVINIPQRRLFVMADGVVAAQYPVGLGRRDWPTFVGPFTITVKELDPVWDVPVSIQEEQRRAGKPILTRVLPGPDNPLGKFWLGLSVPGYGIHGTNAPASISKFQTHGCIRLGAADIEDLFARVEVGTQGIAVYEPILVALVDRELWLEAHPDVYRRDRRDPLGYVALEAARLAPTISVDMAVVTRVLAERSGRPERIGPRREP